MNALIHAVLAMSVFAFLRFGITQKALDFFAPDKQLTFFSVLKIMLCMAFLPFLIGDAIILFVLRWENDPSEEIYLYLIYFIVYFAYRRFVKEYCSPSGN